MPDRALTEYVNHEAELRRATYEMVRSGCKKTIVCRLSELKGIAPKARMVMQAFETLGGERTGNSLMLLITHVELVGYNYVCSIKIVGMTIV